MEKDDMLDTMAEMAVLVSAWIDLDLEVVDGKITAEEARKKFNNFLIPLAIETVTILMLMGDDFTARMDEAKSRLDRDRENIITSKKEEAKS